MEAVLYLMYATLASSLLVPLVASREEVGARPAIAISLAGVAAYLAGALLLVAEARGTLVEYYDGLVVHDSFSAMMVLSSGVVAVVTLLAAAREPALWTTHPAYYSLLPLSLFGVFFLAGAMDALVVLAAWLLVSVISYVIIALPDDKESSKAAVRYIYMGAVATLLLGLWVASQAVSAADLGIQPLDIAPAMKGTASGLAVSLILAALGFKLGLVPFHWWLPSVYSRAHGRAVALVAGPVKIGFIALLTRIIYQASQQPFGFETLAGGTLLAGTLAVASIATMTYGNIAALTPRSVQAILAYSSIAHVGYILAGLAALAYLNTVNPSLAGLALAGIAIQSLAYGLSKAPLFSLAPEAGQDLDDWRGLAGSSKATGIGVAVLLLSLLGLPPLLGFWGKLYIFIAAASYSMLLVLIALVNSGISSAYYIRILREVLTGSGEEKIISDELKAAIILASLLTIALGLLAPALLSLI